MGKVVLCLVGVAVGAYLFYEFAPAYHPPHENRRVAAGESEEGPASADGPVSRTAIDVGDPHDDHATVDWEKRYWYESRAMVAALQENFSSRIDAGKATRSDAVRARKLGERGLTRTAGSWEEMPEPLRIDFGEFANLPQELRFGVHLLCRDAVNDYRRKSEDGVWELLGPERTREYDAAVFENPLAHSPVEVLRVYGADGWESWPGFAEEFAWIRIEALRAVALDRFEWESCMQEGYGSAMDLGVYDYFSADEHLAIIAPDAIQYEIGIDNGLLEMRQRLVALISMYQNEG